MIETPHVSVVLPVYNQADHIEHIVKNYLAALDNLKQSIEIILVVNASRDGSLERCESLTGSYPLLKVLHNDLPGWGRALKAGFAASSGEILCYTNSARTSSYALALHIMLGLANPGLVIKANRRLRHPFVRRMGSVFYNVQCRNLFDLPVWDVNGTPKVFSRDTLDSLDLKENGDLVDLEFIVRCKQLGLQILEVPIVSTVRHGGESTTNWASAVRMYWGAFRMWRSTASDQNPDRGSEN
ncbi:MAG: glycosyltransferase [Desulfomonile tiedjei]|nr:glycosyltransferase [Desulfomonile tiedjei]